MLAVLGCVSLFLYPTSLSPKGPLDFENPQISKSVRRSILNMTPEALNLCQAVCSQCGNTFAEDSVFCRKCGAKRETAGMPRILERALFWALAIA